MNKPVDWVQNNERGSSCPNSWLFVCFPFLVIENLENINVQLDKGYEKILFSPHVIVIKDTRSIHDILYFSKLITIMQNWGSQTNYQLNQLPWTCIQKSQCNIESHMFHTNKPVFSVSCSSRNIGLINWAQNNQKLSICMWYALCCANRTFVPCLKTRILSETRDIFVTVVHRKKTVQEQDIFHVWGRPGFSLIKNGGL